MPQSAVLLIDLQRDFLDSETGRMPVDRDAALAVLGEANEILAGRSIVTAVPILVVNQFSPSARIANIFRHGAAVRGTPGAELDPRVRPPPQIKVITKEQPSAFTNPELERFLRSSGVKTIYVLGVFAEGCVRATVADARRRHYETIVVADAVATNAAWKKRFALWAMKRSGAKFCESLVSAVQAPAE